MEGEWLSHNVINAAQKLLKARHSSIGGFRTLFNAEHQIERGRFVQILNVSSSHWITIANVECVQQPSTIRCLLQLQANEGR